jgi:HEAT repeat protein
VRAAKISLAIALAVLVGCRKQPPPLAGGKPVSHWLGALQAPDAGVRKKAVFKLGNVGSTDPAVPPALRDALKDRDAAVRREAILALLKCGRGAREATAALAELQERDADARVRACAAQALKTLARGG